MDTQGDLSKFKADQLWTWAKRQNLPLPERLRCLQELLDREDPQIASYLLEQMHQPRSDATGKWRRGLMAVAEWTRFPTPEERKQMVVLALEEARWLKDTNEPPALWSALRCYASHVPDEQVADFLFFLDEETPAITQQAVLQCIQNVLSLKPPSPGLDLVALQKRVHTIASAALASEHAQDAFWGTLSANALAAAALLQGPQLSDLFVLLHKRRWPSLNRMLLGKLLPAAQEWSKKGDERLGALCQQIQKTHAAEV